MYQSGQTESMTQALILSYAIINLLVFYYIFCIPYSQQLAQTLLIIQKHVKLLNVPGTFMCKYATRIYVKDGYMVFWRQKFHNHSGSQSQKPIRETLDLFVCEQHTKDPLISIPKIHKSLYLRYTNLLSQTAYDFCACL